MWSLKSFDHSKVLLFHWSRAILTCKWNIPLFVNGKSYDLILFQLGINYQFMWFLELYVIYNLRTLQLQYTYCPMSQKVKVIRQLNLVNRV